MKFLKNKKGPLNKFFEKIRIFFTNDVGIDLGTANTLVYVKGKGIIFNQPSLVAVNDKTKKIVALGDDAREMLGRVPKHISIVRPMVDGVISDFDITEELIRYLLDLIQEKSPKLLGPRVVIGVASEITNVERRAVYVATKNAGARIVHIVPEPVAAAVGIGLAIDTVKGHMIVDIGGGTSDIMVISMNGIVSAKNVRVAGSKMNESIVNHIRDVFKLVIGEKSAEELKIHTSPFVSEDKKKRFYLRGRDVLTGLPHEITVSGEEVQLAISKLTEEIIDGIREVLEKTPPEISADLHTNGVHLVGGGALIQGLPEVISGRLGLNVIVPSDPLTSIVEGAILIAENPEKYYEVIIPNEE